MIKYEFTEGLIIKSSGKKEILCDECGKLDCVVKGTTCGKKICLRCHTNIILEDEEL